MKQSGYQQYKRSVAKFLDELSKEHQLEIKKLKDKIIAKTNQNSYLRQEIDQYKNNFDYTSDSKDQKISKSTKTSNMLIQERLIYSKKIQQLMQKHKEQKNKTNAQLEIIEKIKRENCFLRQQLKKTKEDLQKTKSDCIQREKVIEKLKIEKNNFQETLSVFQQFQKMNLNLKKVQKEYQLLKKIYQQENSGFLKFDLTEYFSNLYRYHLQNNFLELYNKNAQSGFFDIIYLKKDVQKYGIALKMTYEDITGFLMNSSIKIKYAVVFNRYINKII